MKTTNNSTRSKKVGDVKVTLCLTADEGLDVLDGGKWLLMCETHGGIIQDTNKTRLWGWANQPEQFCNGCRNRNFTMKNNKGKEIEFRFIAIGAPYGLGAINNSEHPLWEVSSNGFTLGQWRVETIADHKDGEGWCLHGGFREYDLDENLAAFAKQNSIQALAEGEANK